MSIKSMTDTKRKASNKLLKAMYKDIYDSYVKATDTLAIEVAKLKTKIVAGKTTLTISSKESLIKDLKEQTIIIRKELDIISKSGVNKGVGINAGANSKYTYGAMAKNTTLDKTILQSIFSKLNTDLIKIQFLKNYGGLSFSKVIWKSSKIFERDAKNVILEGLIRGRSTLDISLDLKVYVRKGKEQLIHRYANLDSSPKLPDESIEDYKKRVKTFKKRISSKMEYNSVRMARTQVQGAIQDSNIAASSYAPSVESFNWTLSPAHKVYSICEDIAAGNPWTYETFNEGTPPHPNCMSYVKYNEISSKQFDDDLANWSENPTGENTKYLNDWKASYYDPTLAGNVNDNFFNKILKNTN